MVPVINDISSVITPAFVYDENKILERIDHVNSINGCNVLFPLKPFAIADALSLIAPLVAGFSASSLFEAKLARDVSGKNKTIHLTTPGLRLDEVEAISELCDYISFNSLSQWERFHSLLGARVRQGLRVNPQLSFVTDERYDSCRKHSKLGVPLDELQSVLCNDKNLLKDISGLHFHSNCESNDFGHLLETVQRIEANVPEVFNSISWINLGGGYLFEESSSVEALTRTIHLLKSKHELEVFFEPGKGIIGDTAYIVSTVLDLFESDSVIVAVLDTTINHMPEVFEYQYKPDIVGESSKGAYKYILAGASCLAGDLFGKYRFDQPLEVGSKIIFEGMGAYTIVKANMFNGINLPSIYAYTSEEKLELKKKFTYEDFTSRCGVKKYVAE